MEWTFECPECGDEVVLSPGWGEGLDKRTHTETTVIQCSCCAGRFRLLALQRHGFISTDAATARSVAETTEGNL
jgi:transcription elongation factor Elf1